MDNRSGRYNDLIAYIEENFEDIEDSALMDLENRSDEYADLLYETSEMDADYPFIWQTFYGEGELTLTEKEHALLFEFLEREQEMHVLERQAIYLKGVMDALAAAK